MPHMEDKESTYGVKDLELAKDLPKVGGSPELPRMNNGTVTPVASAMLQGTGRLDLVKKVGRWSSEQYMGTFTTPPNRQRLGHAHGQGQALGALH